MRKIVAVAALSAFILPVAAQAETAGRPAAVSYAAPAAGGLPSGARFGAATRSSSKLDDTGTTVIVAAAAAVGGYFLYDITHDNNNDVVSPNN